MKNFIIIVAIIGLIVSFTMRNRGGGGAGFPQTVISGATPVKAVEPNKKVRVVLFTGTEWCPACKTLDSSVISTPAWKEFAAKEIQFRSFDFPADRSKVTSGMQRMAQQYGVRAFPTMLIIGPDHEEISRQVGAGAPVENYKAWIRGHESHFASATVASAPAGEE